MGSTYGWEVPEETKRFWLQQRVGTICSAQFLKTELDKLDIAYKSVDLAMGHEVRPYNDDDILPELLKFGKASGHFFVVTK